MDLINLKRLSDEIKEFETYLAPTSYETECRLKLLEKIQVIVQNTLIDATVEPFGSYETQLLLPSSDIDLNISVKNGCSTARSILRKMDKALSRNRLNIQLRVFGATVPVLKVVDPKTGLTADITAMNNVISSKRTLAWVEKYPELKPLFLVLKHALLSIRFEWDENYEVLSTVKNGLASYSLVCMIVHYLKYDDEDVKKIEGNDEKTKKDKGQDRSKTRLGRLLIGFLKYYSTFDFIKYGLSLTSKNGVFEKISHPVFGVMKRIDEVMAIENPDEPQNNVARSTRTIKQFQAVLSWMYVQLSTIVKSDIAQHSLLGSIVGTGARLPDIPRKNLTEYQFPSIELTEEAIGIYLPSVDPTLFANRNKNRRHGLKRKRFDDDDNNSNGDNYGSRARYNRNDDVGYVRRDKHYSRNYDDHYVRREKYYSQNYDDDYYKPRSNKKYNQNGGGYGNRNGDKWNNDQHGGGGKVKPPKRFRSKYKQKGSA